MAVFLFCAEDVKQKTGQGTKAVSFQLPFCQLTLFLHVSRRQEEEETSGLLLTQKGLAKHCNAGKDPLLVSAPAPPNSGRTGKEQEPRQEESWPEAKTTLPVLLGGLQASDDFFTAGGAAAPSFGLMSIKDGQRWNFKFSDHVP